MSLNCIVIDDEPIGREGISEYILRIPFLNSMGSFDNPIEASPLVDMGKIDLIFLDIEMPAMSGLDYLATLKKPTAYNYYNSICRLCN